MENSQEADAFLEIFGVGGPDVMEVFRYDVKRWFVVFHHPEGVGNFITIKAYG